MTIADELIRRREELLERTWVNYSPLLENESCLVANGSGNSQRICITAIHHSVHVFLDHFAEDQGHDSAADFNDSLSPGDFSKVLEFLDGAILEAKELGV